MKILILILFFCSSSFAQDILYPTGKVIEDDEIKNLKWYRYTTDNYTILSINDSQGKWLNSNIKSIENWCLLRWGFLEKQTNKECRIFCVPNKELLKKLFLLEQSKVENREELTAMWLILDDTALKTISPYLSQSLFDEQAWWFKRGASILNGYIPSVRENVKSFFVIIEKDQSIFDSEKLFTLTEEEYLKQTEENKRIFDTEVVILCLMLRKEFGQVKLHSFLEENDANQGLKRVYGFSGFNHFDKQYIRFVKDLTRDVEAGITPDSYLNVP